MKRVVISYLENHKKPILIALSIIREYSDMELDHIGKLLDQFVHGQQNISYDVPDEVLPQLLHHLNADGFTYQVVDAPSVI